jgi:hypothetical protein
VTSRGVTASSNIATAHFARAAGWMISSALCMLCAGCAYVPDIRHKPQYLNPFPQIRTVAVLPFVNQSKEPTLSGERVALSYANELQAIRGFDVLPVGAVQLKLSEFRRPLSSGADFQAFAQYLGVDVVVVGSVTDYDPYYPPRMTMVTKWYASNPGFHPVLPGYGLPWGTKEERKIPNWIKQEAERALAAEQLKTQSPAFAQPPSLLPGEGYERLPPFGSDADATASGNVATASYQEIYIPEAGQLVEPLPKDWPDPRGFVPDPPSTTRPPMLAQAEPVIQYMRSFNGHDEDFTEQLADYFYFRDDARFGGWQAYLQRSEDFIRFCCHLHIAETLALRGGQDKSRLIFRWPLDRYSR